MLWDIRDRMKPALSVIDMIPDVHRSAALAALRRAVWDGRPATLRMTVEDKELAFHDAPVQLTSPIGARVLRALYAGGHLKLKKPPRAALPALEAYIATEAAFRAEVARIIAADDAKRLRLAEIVADPSCATVAELTPYLVDKVISAHLGHAAYGSVAIAGVPCHRAPVAVDAAERERSGIADRPVCWWLDADGKRQGDAG